MYQYAKGKIYIGCTVKSLDIRFKEHLNRCLTTDSNTKLYNSIRKHGVGNFIIELIEECELSCIYETEKKHINELNTYKNGLNSTLGGEGCLGYTHTDIIKLKISNNLKNGNSHKGKTYEELYGENCEIEKKRKSSVKNFWSSYSDEEKHKRIKNAQKKLQEKSKLTIEFIRIVKTKINNGLTSKEFKKLYPDVRFNLFYEIRSGKRWNNI